TFKKRSSRRERDVATSRWIARGIPTIGTKASAMYYVAFKRWFRPRVLHSSHITQCKLATTSTSFLHQRRSHPMQSPSRKWRS
ncbi:hypothetical protein SPRG_17405, partial [Saprolegnia parasitica CBS 223.65]